MRDELSLSLVTRSCSLAFSNYNQAPVRSRHGAANHKQIVFDIDFCDRQSFDRHAGVAHVARRTRSFDNARRIGRLADRTRGTDAHRTVRFGTSAKIVSFDRSGKTPSFRFSDDLDLVAVGKYVNFYLIADGGFRFALQANFL